MYNKSQVDLLDSRVTALVDDIDKRLIHTINRNVTNVYLSANFSKDSIKATQLESIKEILGIDSYDDWASKTISQLLGEGETGIYSKQDVHNRNFMKFENTLSYTTIKGSRDLRIEPVAVNGPCKISILLSNNTVEVNTNGKAITYSKGDVALLNTKLPHSRIITSGADCQRWLLIEGFTNKNQFPSAWVDIALNS